MTARQFNDPWLRNLKPPTSGQARYLMTIPTALPNPRRALQLIVGHAGTKTFRAIRYVNSKAVATKIGHYPTMTLAQALVAVDEFAEGRTPATVNKDSFKAVAERWYQEYVEVKGLRTADEIRRKLQNQLIPHFGSMKFVDLRRKQILDYLRTQTPASADWQLGLISAICKWYCVEDENYNSPIVPGMKQYHYRARNRVLSEKELKQIWASTGHDHFGAFIRLLLLTGQRRSMVAEMKWSDLDDNVWTLPNDSDREKGNIGRVRLPDFAMKIINSQPRISRCPYVLYNVRYGRRGKNDLQETYGGAAPWTLHDLRRTSRTLLTPLVDRDTAERVLGHRVGGKVERIYDRDPYFEPKSQALQLLADRIVSIVRQRKRLK